MKKNFAVIGLGSFGSKLCLQLAEQGANVMAIDSDEERVNRIAEEIPLSYCCDCTKEETLRRLDLGEVDCVVIAIGANIEATILMLVLLKEFGVKRIIVRAEEETTKRVMLRLGADEVIDAWELAVNNLCGRLLNQGITQYFRVTESSSVATLKYSGKEPSRKLSEMDLRMRYHLNVLLIRRNGEDHVPTGDDRFLPGDSVVVFGTNAAIKKMDRQIL